MWGAEGGENPPETNLEIIQEASSGPADRDGMLTQTITKERRHLE